MATLLSTAFRVLLTAAGGLLPTPSLAADLLPDNKVEGLLPEAAVNFLVPFVKLCLL